MKYKYQIVDFDSNRGETLDRLGREGRRGWRVVACVGGQFVMEMAVDEASDEAGELMDIAVDVRCLTPDGDYRLIASMAISPTSARLGVDHRNNYDYCLSRKAWSPVGQRENVATGRLEDEGPPRDVWTLIKNCILDAAITARAEQEGK
jgi:hypothetical protein